VRGGLGPSEVRLEEKKEGKKTLHGVWLSSSCHVHEKASKCDKIRCSTLKDIKILIDVHFKCIMRVSNAKIFILSLKKLR
jgi:hypothetical protein